MMCDGNVERELPDCPTGSLCVTSCPTSLNLKLITTNPSRGSTPRQHYSADCTSTSRLYTPYLLSHPSIALPPQPIDAIRPVARQTPVLRLTTHSTPQLHLGPAVHIPRPRPLHPPLPTLNVRRRAGSTGYTGRRGGTESEETQAGG